MNKNKINDLTNYLNKPCCLKDILEQEAAEYEHGNGVGGMNVGAHKYERM